MSPNDVSPYECSGTPSPQLNLPLWHNVPGLIHPLSLGIIQYVLVCEKWQGCINAGTLCFRDVSSRGPGVLEHSYRDTLFRDVLSPHHSFHATVKDYLYVGRQTKKFPPFILLQTEHMKYKIKPESSWRPRSHAQTPGRWTGTDRAQCSALLTSRTRNKSNWCLCARSKQDSDFSLKWRVFAD